MSFGMVPEQNNDRRDQIYGLIADGMKKRVATRDANNMIVWQTVLDEKRAWYKTGVVASPFYGSYAKEVEDFRNLAETMHKFMPEERANALAQDIILEYESFCSSIDAMSSMTLRDKNNAQACLIDKGFRQKTERDIKITEEGKRTFLEALTGKEKHNTTTE